VWHRRLPRARSPATTGRGRGPGRRHGGGDRAPRSRRRRGVGQPRWRVRPGPPPAGDRRAVGGRGPAHDLAVGALRRHLQRRDLQPSRAARRADRGAVARSQRHRGHARGLRPRRRDRDPAAAHRDVRAGGLGHLRADLDPGSRSPGREAAVLGAARRRRRLRVGAQGPAGPPRVRADDRSRRLRPVHPPRLRAGAALDLRRPRQAGGWQLRRPRSRARPDAAPLLRPGRGRAPRRRSAAGGDRRRGRRSRRRRAAGRGRAPGRGRRPGGRVLVGRRRLVAGRRGHGRGRAGSGPDLPHRLPRDQPRRVELRRRDRPPARRRAHDAGRDPERVSADRPRAAADLRRAVRRLVAAPRPRSWRA
jgi:hypothetical protein